MTRNGSSGFFFFRAVQKYQEECDQRFGRGYLSFGGAFYFGRTQYDRHQQTRSRSGQGAQGAERCQGGEEI